jgi:hypothetical protein
MQKPLVWTLVVLAIGVIVAVIFLQRRRQQTHVIGQELAEARKREDARPKKTEKSPLPQGKHEFQQGAFGLLNPRPTEFDSALRAACRHFRGLDARQREAFRSSISMDEFGELTWFAKRQAVFALRAGMNDEVRDALAAIAMIEAKRTDHRDILWALAVVRHAAEQVDAATKITFAEAAALAEPDTGKMIMEFGQRAWTSGDWARWGYRQVKLNSGLGLVQLGFRPYAPDADLLAVALDLAAVIDADRYDVASLEIAAELPEVWLKTEAAGELKRVLAAISGGATLHASAKNSEASGPIPPGLLVFLVETSKPSDAEILTRLAREKISDDKPLLGVSSGRLFCLVVASSFVHNARGIETNDSMRRFAEPLLKPMAEAGGSR